MFIIERADSPAVRLNDTVYSFVKKPFTDVEMSVNVIDGQMWALAVCP